MFFLHLSIFSILLILCLLFAFFGVSGSQGLTNEGTSDSHPTLKVNTAVPNLLSEICPWTSALPSRLRERLHWSSSSSQVLNETHASLILYAGEDDATSLQAHMIRTLKDWPVNIVEIDNKRPGCEVSLHSCVLMCLHEGCQNWEKMYVAASRRLGTPLSSRHLSSGNGQP